MHIDQRSDLSLQQHLHLTPELRQGIAVLQMTAIDLGEYAKTCVEENPFLDDDDWQEPKHPTSPDTFSQAVSSDALFEKRGHGSPENFDRERTDMSQRSFSFDRYLVEGESLDSHLLEQLEIQIRTQRQRAIAEYLIGSIDESGYLKTSCEEASQALGVDEEEVEQVLELIHRCQPVGIGARNLAECLKLQLGMRGELSEQLEDLIDSHLQEFETRSPSAIARSMGIPLAELSEELDVIRSCNPRPAAQFGRSPGPIWPEIVVEMEAGGGYGVHLRDFYLPHLRVNEYYRTLATRVEEPDAKKYLKEKLKEAENLIENINYRRTTLYRVACCIVELQVEFFDNGFDSIRPLTMAQVAKAVDISEPTVSRISNGNYMQTPRGVFELRFFFHSSAKGASDRIVSSVSVKHRISDLVSKEDKMHPLSDQDIADELARIGVSISRRTVNKYRDELNIPAKALRKRG